MGIQETPLINENYEYIGSRYTPLQGTGSKNLETLEKIRLDANKAEGFTPLNKNDIHPENF